ncbi:PQ loop repeat-domain-containing protein [Pyronema omphalodes]|nr:PQ loop repeat-domain-containing protein [Pyronema omphalodes]
MTSDYPLLHALSRLLGWSYFLCWGISFYPQLIQNYRRKSVTGLAVDYFVMNVFGFACYTVSCLLFLFSPVVRDEYARRHPNAPEPTVRGNDLAFAAHALLISIATLCQFYFFNYTRNVSQRLSWPMAAILLGSLTTVAISCTLVNGANWTWLDVVYTLTTIKLLLSLLKYLPQAYLNYQRKSTIGWSIENILLDLSGGYYRDWSGILGNPVKFFLGQISLGFDVVFLVQHWGLYKEREEGEGGRDAERAEWDGHTHTQTQGERTPLLVVGGV